MVALWIVITWTLMKLGLFAMLIAVFVVNTYDVAAVLAVNYGMWAGTAGFVSIATILALALLGFFVSLGGRSLISEEALES